MPSTPPPPTHHRAGGFWGPPARRGVHREVARGVTIPLPNRRLQKSAFFSKSAVFSPVSSYLMQELVEEPQAIRHRQQYRRQHRQEPGTGDADAGEEIHGDTGVPGAGKRCRDGGRKINNPKTPMRWGCTDRGCAETAAMARHVTSRHGATVPRDRHGTGMVAVN